jgi:DNA-binding SARP family transcriptional activator
MLAPFRTLLLRETVTVVGFEEHLTTGGPPMLQLRLFGAPEVCVDGQPVRFDTRKAVALLAYLAVTGRPQQRDVLAVLLWPELDQTKARGALRRTLSVASKIGSSLRAEQKTVWLDTEQTVSDVEQFRVAAAETGAERWRTASDLATEPFMAGFSLRDSPTFDDW